MEIKGDFLFSIQLAISSELSPIAHRLIPTEIEGNVFLTWFGSPLCGVGPTWCGSYRGVGPIVVWVSWPAVRAMVVWVSWPAVRAGFQAP